MPLRSRLLVAAQLAHRLGLPYVQQRRRLGLHHHQGDAVDEQHKIGDDHSLVVLRSASLVASSYAELRCDDELVQAALRVVEVEEANGAGVPSPGTAHGQGHPVGQVLVDGLVVGNAGAVHVLKVEDDAAGLLLRHPLVEAQQRGPHPALQQHLALVGALSRERVAGHVSPPQPLQQQPRRLLGMVELVELAGGGHLVL